MTQQLSPTKQLWRIVSARSGNRSEEEHSSHTIRVKWVQVDEYDLLCGTVHVVAENN